MLRGRLDFPVKKISVNESAIGTPYNDAGLSDLHSQNGGVCHQVVLVDHPKPNRLPIWASAQWVSLSVPSRLAELGQSSR